MRKAKVATKARKSVSPEMTATKKAVRTGKWAEIIFRALSSRVAKRWKFISFRGEGGGEWRGIVDVLAIRKDTDQPSAAELKRGDLFDIVLVQIKGGTARGPNAEDRRRLLKVAKHYNARGVVLFEWRNGSSSKFKVLVGPDKWMQTPAEAIFGT